MGSTISYHRGPWRFDELPELPDDGRRYEVVDGSLAYEQIAVLDGAGTALVPWGTAQLDLTRVPRPG